MTYPTEISFSPMLHMRWALGDSPWSDQTAQTTSPCGCVMSTHTLAINVAGSKREHRVSLVFFIVSAQKLHTSLPPTVYQLKLVTWHPLQGVWEMWGGAHTYSVRIKYLPQCDNDDGNHLYCHPNHCASPSPTLWLPARYLFYILQFLSIYCPSFNCEEEGEAQRGETYTFTVI